MPHVVVIMRHTSGHRLHEPNMPRERHQLTADGDVERLWTTLVSVTSAVADSDGQGRVLPISAANRDCYSFVRHGWEAGGAARGGELPATDRGGRRRGRRQVIQRVWKTCGRRPDDGRSVGRKRQVSLQPGTGGDGGNGLRGGTGKGDRDGGPRRGVDSRDPRPVKREDGVQQRRAYLRLTSAGHASNDHRACWH